MLLSHGGGNSRTFVVKPGRVREVVNLPGSLTVPASRSGSGNCTHDRLREPRSLGVLGVLDAGDRDRMVPSGIARLAVTTAPRGGAGRLATATEPNRTEPVILH